jgi:methylated-DNA-[protein]-cysteine S-methyltransferase
MEKNAVPTIFWTLLVHQKWKIHVAATLKGLVFVGSQNKSLEELSDWVERRFPDSPLVKDDEKLKPYTAELIEYLDGKRKNFSVAFDFQGTPFQLSVWNALCEVPYGQTLSYSDIANQINRPASVRAVGTAIGANPLLISIPCHRVIGKNGSLTGYRGGLDMKTQLLELERKISFNEGGSLHA